MQERGGGGGGGGGLEGFLCAFIGYAEITFYVWIFQAHLIHIHMYLTCELDVYNKIMPSIMHRCMMVDHFRPLRIELVNYLFLCSCMIVEMKVDRYVTPNNACHFCSACELTLSCVSRGERVATLPPSSCSVEASSSLAAVSWLRRDWASSHSCVS